MKKLLALTLVVAASYATLSFVLADEYKVVKVNGQIIYVSNGKEMSRGDIFRSDLSLKFKTENSRAAVISKAKGTMVLTPKSGVKTSLIPAMNDRSSRAAGLNNILDLQKHFVDKYLILDQLELEVGKEAFPLSNSLFFYLQYNYQGEIIRKKLPIKGNKVLFSAENIFSIDGNPIKKFETEMTLYLRDADKKSNTKINTFTPVFPDQEELKEELEVILDEFDSLDKEATEKEIRVYLNEFYGKPNKPNLQNWLNQNLTY